METKNIVDFSKYTDDEILLKFYQWAYDQNQYILTLLEKGFRYGIHPYIYNQFEKYKKLNNLDEKIGIVSCLNN